MNFLSWLIAVSVFAISSAFSPGPNNLMLLASGTTFGVRRTLPHIAGVAVGFPAMTLVIGVVLGGAFSAYPMIHTILKVAGIGYMLYLAWKTALSRVAVEERTAARPLTFLEAALFQWVNPKAWVMATGAIAAYTGATGDTVFGQLGWLTLVFLITGIGSASTWAAAGSWIARWLHTPRHIAIFNLTIAVLLVLAILPMMVE